jgi:aspartate racemase
VSRVGLIGGLGPESTIDYYRRLLEAWGRERPGSAPGIVIDSLDVQRVIPLVERDHEGLVRYLSASIRRLAGAGVDFAALTANTPHLVFDELAAASPVPLVSIVETCALEAKRRGLARPLLLGTRFTMEGPFYPKIFARHGLELVRLERADVEWVHERYMGELLKGEFRDATRDGFVALVTRLHEARGIDAVILGGTELPLLLTTADVAGVPTLDTTALHVRAIVQRLLELEGSRDRD